MMEEMERMHQQETDELLQEEETQAKEAPKYVPRPAWQVWAARVALVLFVALVIMYYIHMFRGGK